MNRATKEFKDYYQILKIPDHAEPPEIKKAYRKLALENHPDHHPDDPQSENRFKEITEAYGVLIDPGKKREYDLYRAAIRSGKGPGPNPFSYSQQEIFENMFRQGFSADMFEELNREFSKSGFRSGNPFFHSMLTSGAIGGLTQILGMIPGPVGKIARVVGSSFLVYNNYKKSKTPASPDSPAEKTPDMLDSIKGVFKKGAHAVAPANPLDIHLAITLPPVEVLAGTQKKISYKVGEEKENLVVRIPKNFPANGKLRVREKGNQKNGERGDLILTIKLDSPGNA